MNEIIIRKLIMGALITALRTMNIYAIRGDLRRNNSSMSVTKAERYCKIIIQVNK